MPAGAPHPRRGRDPRQARPERRPSRARRLDVTLDLTADPVELTATLVDTHSESGNEGPLADAVEAGLRSLEHLRVVRDGDAVVAFTDLGRSRRVVLAGHLDTVPIVDNVP